MIFNAAAPIVLVGDSAGGVTSLKLSPNLRRITPVPTPPVRKGEVPPPPMRREEIEARWRGGGGRAVAVCRRVDAQGAPGSAAADAPLPPRPQVRKLDRILAASDARINIVTPVPGAEEKVKVVTSAGETDHA